MEVDGLTGKLQFDHKSGYRNYFKLEIVELANAGFKKIGVWDPQNDMSYTRTRNQMLDDLVNANMNKTFIVASKIVSVQKQVVYLKRVTVGTNKFNLE